jgi:hypothetical protein
MPGPFARRYALALLLLLFSGCVRPVTRTIVTGRIEPRQIHFTTIVHQTDDDEPGGWRVACLHINIQRANTGESFLCRFGVEVPIENRDSAFSLQLAQRITAERTHEATQIVFGSATPESPLGLLCETLKNTLKPLLKASIGGARVNTACREETIPVQFGEFVP